MMGDGLHASVIGVDTVDLRFTLGKIMQFKNMQHIPSIKMNHVSGSRLLKDGFNFVFESNKLYIPSKYGSFVEKTMGAKAYFSYLGKAL